MLYRPRTIRTRYLGNMEIVKEVENVSCMEILLRHLDKIYSKMELEV